MALKLADINGNPYIGVFCRLVGRVALCPIEAADDFTEEASKTLGVECVKATLGSTNLHGSLIGANTRGFIVPYFYDMEEIEKALAEAGMDLKEDGPRGAVSEDPHTAWGNNILVGDKVALANPDLMKESLSLVEETLEVEVVSGTIAGIKTVGSVAALNGKGMVVHPKASEKEVDELAELFDVEVKISTANFGSPYLGASMIVNDRGALVGSKTSGVEMNRIENTLDIM